MEAGEFNRLLRSLHKDERALETLYNFYYARIIKHLLSYCDEFTATDIAQDFFIHLIDISQKQDYVTYPTAWVYKCCENMALRRGQYVKKLVPLEDEVLNVAAPETESFEELETGMKQLDEETQRIIKMVYWEGYNLKEIADILNINPATIRKKHSRAMKKLKNLLSNVTI